MKMCGILAIEKNIIVPNSLKIRGKDSLGQSSVMINNKTINFYHCLHALVNNVEQPLRGRGVFISNCEIYNWKELSKKYSIESSNDAELIFLYMESLEKIVYKDTKDNYHITKELLKFLSEIEGSYAIIYSVDKKLIAFRDPLGIRQLSYDKKSIAIGSTPKILLDLGIECPIELHPRKMIIYDSSELNYAHIPFSIPLQSKSFIEELTRAIKSRIPTEDFGILFSGGIDSLLIAALAKKVSDKKIHLINVSTPISSDRIAAIESAKELGMELTIIEPSIEEINIASKEITEGINESNALKVASSIPTWIASKYASSIGLKVLFTGFGADEILAGYLRSRNNMQRNTERFAQLLMMWESNLLKEDIASMNHTVEVRYPYVSFNVISSAWKNNHKDPKEIIREELKKLNLPYERKKVASHYGSGINALLKKNDKSQSKKLKEYAQGKNIGALISTGKDSLFATYLLKNFNYNINCMITIHSKNKDSYMYHTPSTNLSEDIAKLMNTPLIAVENDDEKEKELDSLRIGLKKAIEEYDIKGICSGAIQSNYQRTRLLLLCEEFGLSLHSPLWQTDIERYVNSLFNAGFKIIITRCSAEGLTKEDCGREYNNEFIEKIKNNKLSLIGEGGEFETLVLKCPLYNGEILIGRSSIIDRDNDYILEIKDYQILR